MTKFLVSLFFTFTAAIAFWPAADSETWRIDNITSIGGYKTTVFGHPKVITDGGAKAVEFNGVNDALLVDNHPLAGAKTFTWEVIFKPYSKGGAEQRFFHMQQNGADFRYLFETRLIDGKWCLDSFANTTTGSKPLMDRAKLHTLDQWHHVAMVYDGSEFRHYVDGQLQGSATVTLSPMTAGKTSIGVRMNKVDYFKGAIRLARMTMRPLDVTEFLNAK